MNSAPGSSPIEKVRWKSYLPAVALAIGSFIALLAVSLVPKQESGQFAVLFHPAMTRDQVFSSVVNAGGRPVREGVFETLIIAAFQEPGFEGRLRRGGALLVFDPLVLGACFVRRNYSLENAS